MAIRADKHFGWTRRLESDIEIDGFEDKTTIFDFDWNLAVWWNSDLAWLAPILTNPEMMAGLGDPLPPDMRRGLEGSQGREIYDCIAERAPWTESRCVDHMEMALRHIIKANIDVQGRPFMVYDSGTGTWKKEGEILTSARTQTVGSLIARCIDDFATALNRGADLLRALIDIVEPFQEPPDGAATTDDIEEYERYEASRAEMFAAAAKAHKMARDIPRGKYSALQAGLRQRLAVAQTTWDSDMRWIVLKDGAINVDEVQRRGIIELLDFSPMHMSTMSLSVGLRDAERNAGISEWDRGVEKVLPDREVRTYLQKRFGAALLGRPGEAGKSMVWQYGVGDTAKSTLQECIAGARGVFAPYSVVSTSDALTQKGAARGAGERFKAYSRGKRFAIMSELADNEQLDQALLKQITGGETVEGTAKYANAVTFYFTATLFMASNHTPQLPAGDTAALGRIHVVPFEHRLWVRSKNPKEWAAAPPEHRADEQWATRVLESPQERSAILQWVLQGLRQYGIDGGIGDVPNAMKEARDEFAADADPVAKIVYAMVGEEPSYSGAATIRICTDFEWDTEGLLNRDGVPKEEMEVLINQMANRLGFAQMEYGQTEAKLSQKWMRNALSMIHEKGGSKRKTMLDSATNRTAMVFTRVRKVDVGGIAPGITRTWGGIAVPHDL